MTSIAINISVRNTMFTHMKILGLVTGTVASVPMWLSTHTLKSTISNYIHSTINPFVIEDPIIS